jgi:hypothetical protein
VTTADDLLWRIRELDAQEPSRLKQIYHANRLITAGDLDGAEALIDAVEAAMHPVGGGGFVGARFNIPATVAAPSVNNYLELTLTTPPAAADPDGWLGVGTYDSPDYWGESFPEGHWLSLPAGTYAPFALVNPTTLENTTGHYLLSLISIDNVFATVDDIFVGASDPAQRAVSAAEQVVSGEGVRCSGVFHVDPALAPLAFVLAFSQTSGDDLALANGYLVLQKIA